MKIAPTIVLACGLLCFAGCTTNYHKPGASTDDFNRDIALAEGRAASDIQNSTMMPAQSGLEAMARGITVPILKRKLVKKYMQEYGWQSGKK